jgi:electron transport complex protein RnfB
MLKGPIIDEEICIGCTACVQSCPISPPIINMKDKKAHASNSDGCIHCTACAMSCPVGAIALGKRDGPTY